MRVLQKTLSVYLLFCAWGISFTSCSFGSKNVAPRRPTNAGFLFRLQSIYQCEGYEDKKFNFYMENVSITRHNQTEYLINADMCARVDVGGTWAGSIIVRYQETMDGTQPVEMYREFTDSVCNDTMVQYKKEIEEKAAYIENMNPVCPIPAGCYKMNGMPFDTFQFVSAVKTGYYFVTANGTMDGEMLWCTTSVFKCEFDDDKNDDDYGDD